MTLFYTLYAIYFLIGMVVAWADDYNTQWDDTVFTILLWPAVVLVMIYVWYRERK